MRRFLIGFSLLFLLAFHSEAVLAFSEKEAKDVFAQSIKAYQSAQYKEAIRLNESILREGYFSPALYYNLGNAYFKSGQLGFAILNLVKAQKLSPRDSDIKANLSFLRPMVDNDLPWTSNPILTPLAGSWTVSELLWIGFGFLAVTGIFVLVGLFIGLARKRLWAGVVLGGILTFYVFASGFSRMIYFSGMGVAIKKTDARFEPNEKATIYFKIPEGAQIKVLRNKDGWMKIQRSDGKLGWLPATVIERI